MMWTYAIQQLTWADIAVFEATNATCEAYSISKLRPYVKLKEFHDKVASRVCLPAFA